MSDKPVVGVNPLAEALATIVPDAPTWTRLEPQSLSGDPTPGLQAHVHDPLWLLARQWQLGEFQGEDAGSPVGVQVKTRTLPLTAWQPGDRAADQPVHEWGEGDLLDPLVEREPATAAQPGLRQRAEAGAQLLVVLRDAQAEGVRDEVIAACPLALAAEDPFDPRGPRLLAALRGRLPDAEMAARSLEAAAPPAWLSTGTEEALRAVGEWHAWYRAAVAPLPDPDQDAWIGERLEHRFGVQFGRGDDAVVLRATEFGGGRAEWYAFEHDPAGELLSTTQNPRTVETTLEVFATPLRFQGMPADRYWQFEDGAVNLGMLQAQPHDLARLCLVEFAMIYSNDWLVVPIDVAVGGWTTITSVSYTNTFGERIDVPDASDAGRTGSFRLFQITTADSTSVQAAGAADPTLKGMFVPDASYGALQGPDREEVVFLRDEMANMAWAVERTVEGPSGEARSRGDEPGPAPPQPGPEDGVDFDYLLQTDVPAHWIPFVPVSTGLATSALRKGAMVRDGEKIHPLGVALRPQLPLTIADEEIPREGLRLRRVPMLARRADGSYVRWTARRVSMARGEGSSALAFDEAVPRRPPG